MSEWRTIDSAPKDGSHFLAVTDYGLRCVMKWNAVQNEIQRVVTCRRCDGYGLGQLTHWQPLPPPPDTGAA